jgi:hypothetical protein
VLAGLNGGDAASLIDQAVESAGLSAARPQKLRGYSLGIEQIEGIAPMNQEDRAAWPMYGAFTSKPDSAPYNVVPNQIPLTQGLTAASSASRATSSSARVRAAGLCGGL